MRADTEQNTMRLRRFRSLLGAVSLGMLLLTGCGPREVRYTGASLCMGTVFSEDLTCSGEDPGPGLEDIGKDLEQCISYRIDTSEIARVNSSAGDPEGYPPSPELYEILEQTFAIAEKSGGAFDPTLGALTTLWKLDEGAADPENYELPAPEAVAEARARCGYEKVRLEDGRIYLPEGMALDLGAIGKGMYLNRVREHLTGSDTRGTVSAGGSILTVGEKGTGAESLPWSIGITDPLDPDGLCGMIEVRGSKCISTSGDYERYVERDGVRYHHILDPETGYPAVSDYVSATVLCDDGVLSDALSTACFVLAARDPEEAFALARDYGAQLLLIDGNGKATGDLELLAIP